MSNASEFGPSLHDGPFHAVREWPDDAVGWQPGSLEAMPVYKVENLGKVYEGDVNGVGLDKW